jgi:hypothetical protein
VCIRSKYTVIFILCHLQLKRTVLFNTNPPNKASLHLYHNKHQLKKTSSKSHKKHSVIQPIRLSPTRKRRSTFTSTPQHHFRKISILPIQPKLKVSNSKSPQEKEANRIAAQITQNDTPSIKNNNQSQPGIIQAKPVRQAQTPGQEVNSSLAAQINRSKGSGQALPQPTRSFFEQRIGHDFSKVRIHTSAAAARFNRNLHARAFTFGQDVYFNQGQYNPQSREGKWLLGHELVHVVQQNKMLSQPQIQRQKIKGELKDYLHGKTGTTATSVLRPTTLRLPSPLRHQWDVATLKEIRKIALRAVLLYNQMVRGSRKGKRKTISPYFQKRYKKILRTLERKINEIKGIRLKQKIQNDLLSPIAQNTLRRHQIISLRSLISGNKLLLLLSRKRGLHNKYLLYFTWLDSEIINLNKYLKHWS